MLDRNSSLILIVGGAILLAGLIATAQEPRQEWQLRQQDSRDMVNFRVERWQPGSHWSNSNSVPLSRFHGITAESFDHNGKVKFEYVTDAGVLVCEGEFGPYLLSRRGSGTYRVQADPGFVTELKKLGYMAPDEEQTFSMILMNVSLAFARGARNAGLHPTTRELIDLRSHGVTLDYMAETSAAGYGTLSVQDYIDMRNHGVTTDFLRDLKRYGYNTSVRGIVDMRNHGVTSDFVADLKDAGYDLQSSEIVDLRNHGVSSQFVQDLHAYGLRPAAADLVQLRDHGVNAEFLRDLKDAGYSNLRVGDITDLRSHGVNGEFIRESKSLGYNFTARELIDLRTHGVDGGYLRRLRDAGMKNLTADQIEKLRTHGVD